MLSFWKLVAQLSIGLTAIFISFSSHAGLFDDEEARKAILELRQRVDNNRLAAEAAAQRADGAAIKQAEELKESTAALRRSLLDLQNQIEALRSEQAKMRGQDEQLARDLAEVQRRQKDIAQGVEDRMRKFEPAKVTVDGREFTADPAEKRDYDAAFAIFRKPDFPAAQTALSEFVRRYPQSGYNPSALFWLGNAQYANRDYQGAINNFRNMIAQAPDHPKSSEAALSIANCQVELKDTRAARKTLEDLIKVYPKSEAAVAAAERLTRMK
jgi:tol-pal system protein YbgF